MGEWGRVAFFYASNCYIGGRKEKTTYICFVLFLIWIWRTFYFEKLLDYVHHIQLIIDARRLGRSPAQNPSAIFLKQRLLDWNLQVSEGNKNIWEILGLRMLTR